MQGGVDIFQFCVMEALVKVDLQGFRDIFGLARSFDILQSGCRDLLCSGLVTALVGVSARRQRQSHSRGKEQTGQSFHFHGGRFLSVN